MRYLHSHVITLLAILVCLNYCASAQAPPVIWQRCYGGDSADYIINVKPTPDGGYIAAGSTRSSDGDLAGNGGVKGLWVLKLDGSGNIQWERTYNDSIIGANYIEPTNDGGYIVTGSHTLKLNNDGSTAWIVKLFGYVIHQTKDNGYILCGSGPSLIKLQTDGSIAWQKYSNDTLVGDICETFNGDGYMITGSIYDIHASPFIARTDSLGNITNLSGGYGHGIAHNILRTHDSAYLYTNYSGSSGGFSVNKISGTLAPFWSASVTPSGAITTTVDYGFAIWTNEAPYGNDLTITKYDSSRNVSWGKPFHGSQTDGPTSIVQAENGNYIVSGRINVDDSDITGSHGNDDGWIAVLGTNTGVQPVAISAEIKVYPIPATDILNVGLPHGFSDAEVRLVDVSGRIIQTENSNSSHRILDLSALPAGAYLLNVINKGAFYSYKVTHY